MDVAGPDPAHLTDETALQAFDAVEKEITASVQAEAEEEKNRIRTRGKARLTQKELELKIAKTALEEEVKIRHGRIVDAARKQINRTRYFPLIISIIVIPIGLLGLYFSIIVKNVDGNNFYRIAGFII